MRVSLTDQRYARKQPPPSLALSRSGFKCGERRRGSGWNAHSRRTIPAPGARGQCPQAAWPL